MLENLFGKKSDHPMATIKSAQALLTNLPKSDALKALMELADWVESVADSEEFRLAEQFVVLCLLDETAQPYVRRLTYDYFTLPDMNVFHGNRLCLVLGNWSRHAANGYFTVFRRYCRDDKGGSAIRAHLPLLAARAVHAMRDQLKYAAVHYQARDHRVWQNLAQLYRHAEKYQYLAAPVHLYSSFIEPTSVGSEVGQLLAWYACGINALDPRGMHLTERIVSQYGSSVQISLNLSNKTLLGFNLAHPLDPVRVDLEATMHPLMRYISMAEMQPKLESLIESLERNDVPHELNLGGIYVAEWVLEAARHVLNYLNSPPLRMCKRLKVGGSMNIVHGYENVVGRCKNLGHESSAHPSVEWKLENVSSNGFGAVISGRGADGVHIGELLGIQTTGITRLGVALVRRLQRDAEGRWQVGGEVLANQISGVILRQGVGGGFESGESALWLHDKSCVECNTARLLMQAGTFSMLRSMKTRFEGKDYLLVPIELQEKTTDYDLASFRIIEQETAED